MKRTVRIFALLLALCLCLSTAVSAAADSPRYTNEADILHALGLFNGTGMGYELERTPT